LFGKEGEKSKREKKKYITIEKKKKEILHTTTIE